jgi:VCBS repeat-containing protein
MENDSFTFSVVDREDGGKMSNEAELKIKINGANDAPEIMVECLNKEVTEVMEPKVPGEMEGTAHPTGNLITDSNAMDPEEDTLYVKIDGQVVTQETTITGTYGDLVIQANGSYEYVLNQADVNSLQEGEMVFDNFAFSVVDREDGGKMSNEAELKIKINGANDTPVIKGVCLERRVDFTSQEVNSDNFLDMLPAGVMISAENIDDLDDIFTPQEVGFIDNGAPLHKGIGASSQTIMPGSHVDTQTGFKPTGVDLEGNVIGEAEQLKISFKGPEFPDGIVKIELDITRLFPNEGASNNNETLRWTILKGGIEVGTGDYEASTTDDPLFGADHAVRITIDPNVEFDEVILTALRYNGDAANNGGFFDDSSDFLLAGFSYEYKTLCLTKEVTEVMEPKVPGEMEGTAHPTGNLIIDSNAMDPDDGDDIYVKIGGQVVTQETTITGTYGDLVIQANGSYEYVLNQAEVNSLQEGEMVFDNFVFSVVDREEGGKMSNEAKLVVKINGANDAPTAEANMYMTTEDAININGNILLDDTGAGVDSDPENDPLVVVGIKDLDIQSPIQVTPNLIQDELSTGGDLILELTTNDGAALFTLKADGSWTLENSGGDPFEPLLDGEQVSITFGYTINDVPPEGVNPKMDMSMVEVIIKGEGQSNNPPVAILDCAMTLEGIPIPNLDVFRLGDVDADFDPDGDPILINSFDVVSPFGATITDPNPNDGLLTYTPVDGFVGFDTFTYDIKDVPGGLVSNRATVIVMVSKIYDLNQPYTSNGTNNKHHQGKDGLLDPLTGILVAAPFEGKDPEPIHMLNGKDPQDIAPTGLGLADGDDVGNAHVSSLDWTSNFTLNSGLGQYQLDMKTTPFSPMPDLDLNNSGFATFVEFDTSAVRNILIDFSDEEGNQANFVVSLGTNGNDLINGDLPNLGGDPDRSDQDLISGFGGDDIINSGDDDDVVYGDEKTSFRAPGDDTVRGGGGRDLIYGDNLVLDNGYKGGQDMLFGDAGDDVIWGDARFRGLSDGGEDLIHGGAGRDLLYGDGAILQAFSSAASDKIFGDAGSDDIYGDAKVGQETLAAGSLVAGDDTIEGGAGNDNLWGDFFLVLDDTGLGSNITATHPGGADTFVYNFEGINNLDLGDDNIFDFNVADGDILRFENLLDGGQVLDSVALAGASKVSADPDGIVIDFTDAGGGNLTTITLFGIAFNGGTEISDYIPDANLDFA